MLSEEDLALFCDAVLESAGRHAVRDPVVVARVRTRIERELGGLDFALPASTFASFLGARLEPAEDAASAAAALEALAVGDLYLACGCILGIKAAVDAFVARVSGEIRRVASRFAREGHLSADDLVQIVVTRLLVSDEDKPARLTLYRGRGSLAGFVKVTAARLAINAIQDRSTDREEPEEELFAALVSPIGTPEANVDREDVRARVRDAFIASVATLSARERNVLHYSMCDGLSIDVIARMYGIHRATAARWIESARDDLVRRTRGELRRTLSVPDHDIDTILRGALSKFELSVARLLRVEERAKTPPKG